MLKYVFALCLSFSFFSATAHSPDISSTILAEDKNGNWLLQIGSSLTAFQYEIKNHYGDHSYQSPEEFQALAVEYLKERISIRFNNQEKVTLENGMIRLGHETNAVFQVVGVPKDIQSLTVTNTSFSNISRNQSALVILKKGFYKNRFILNNNHEHTAKLQVNGSEFVPLSAAKINESNHPFPYKALGGGFLILTIGIFAFYKLQNH